MIIFFLLTLTSFDSILRQPELDPAHFGLYVLNLSNDSVVLAYNSQELLIPASNMKIISTAASLTFLGPDYRFLTRLGLNGTVRDQVLHGDVVLIGGGDPTFNIHGVRQFINTLKQYAIKVITGDLIIDDRLFTDLCLHGNNFRFERLPVGWAWHYLDARYAPEITALSFNKNCVNVRMSATKVAEAADVTIMPFTSYVTLNNEMTTKTGQDSIIILRRPENNIIYVDGGIGEGRTVNIQVAVKDPALFLGHYFKEELMREGIVLQGGIMRPSESSSFDDEVQPRNVDSVFSPPLIDILKEMDVESVNLYAEVLLKTLGARYHNDGSFLSGIKVLYRFLELCGIDASQVSLWDGSGLSRHNLLSPYHIALVLRYMYLSRYSAAFFELFPSSGKGTLERRFKEFEGLMRAKTGTLHAVSCLSGFLRVNDTDYCFSMMFNNYTCLRENIEDIQEAVIFALQEELSSVRTRAEKTE